MASPGDYQDYLARYEPFAGKRKRLDTEEFARLHDEYTRLLRRTDPDDIQLDEWKRLDELRFLLVTSDEDEHYGGTE